MWWFEDMKRILMIFWKRIKYFLIKQANGKFLTWCVKDFASSLDSTNRTNDIDTQSEAFQDHQNKTSSNTWEMQFLSPTDTGWNWTVDPRGYIVNLIFVTEERKFPEKKIWENFHSLRSVQFWLDSQRDTEKLENDSQLLVILDWLILTRDR